MIHFVYGVRETLSPTAGLSANGISIFLWEITFKTQNISKVKIAHTLDEATQKYLTND
jgi:hypothetical protein